MESPTGIAPAWNRVAAGYLAIQSRRHISDRVTLLGNRCRKVHQVNSTSCQVYSIIMALRTGNDPASFLIDNEASILQTPRALFLYCFSRFFLHSLNLVVFFGCPSGLCACLVRFAHWATSTLAPIHTTHRVSFVMVECKGIEPSGHYTTGLQPAPAPYGSNTPSFGTPAGNQTQSRHSSSATGL